MYSNPNHRTSVAGDVLSDMTQQLELAVRDGNLARARELHSLIGAVLDHVEASSSTADQAEKRKRKNAADRARRAAKKKAAPSPARRKPGRPPKRPRPLEVATRAKNLELVPEPSKESES